MIEVKPGRRSGLIKSPEELEFLRRAGRELARIREAVVEMVAPGVSTESLDQAARSRMEKIGATPAFLGYHGFPATICASINAEIVHGIPSGKRRLEEGDLVSIDMGLILDGFYSDTAVTVAVGAVSSEADALIEVTRRGLDAGIGAFQLGNRLGDISAAIQAVGEGAGYGVVREYTGHGIGREMHEDPRIKNFGQAGTGMRLRKGMVFALEPMFNLGSWGTVVLDDKWTVVTDDGSLSAHFEHTVALTDEGPEILTKV